MNDPFKMPNPIGGSALSSTSKNKQKKYQPNRNVNLVESFREQGSAATKGVAKNAFDQLFGTNNVSNEGTVNNKQTLQNPNSQPFNFVEFLRNRENKIRQQERSLAQQQRRTEKVLFDRKAEENKREILFIKEEIKKIIKTTQGISAELIAVEQSVMTTTVAAGVYEATFFDRLRKIIILARKRLEESKHWLEMFNNRNKQKSHYWGQVKKSGTTYMLSGERAVVTQTG